MPDPRWLTVAQAADPSPARLIAKGPIVRARLASALGLLLTGLLTASLTVAVFHREPTTRRSSWCPTPEDRASVPILPATESVPVVLRLREIRRKAALLAPPMLDLDSPPAPGSHAELDGLIRDLISDLQVAALREARP